MNLEILKEAIIDMRYLLNRGYNRKTAADYVTSRYKLSKEERAIIFRAVYPDEQAKSRLKKLINIEEVAGNTLLIDGFNNIITIENALRGAILIKCDDGLIRDISYTSRKFKMTQYTEKAIMLIFETLRMCRAKESIFFFDEQISFSGEIASKIRQKMREEGVNGDARTSKRNDTEIISKGGIIASSDSLIMERANKIFDLAGYIINSKFKERILDITIFK
ncbi:MAG: DUF434 domain-containing protein [archaeon YNP-LCB-003-016]|jgi:hypothetical protein|uniref:DUF434 domain-containing protein n=1 Tax=Candidatus Culexarchaeum yellowstonense TaxID=2928963 RepID=UPI0026E92163|nr:DUF434 domain-containing protein [Candidatus Culexarchaeum yellowstonense]MCC6017789.1 DUF434 domain-containing protein [Candidatus Verstraetearchaeota archaeon]MCR6668610.1 DUF434 domain-containing protein [Candidatus Culexarchaeum yellowstonense]MCR6690828.1 DUF434 domain-containing protein [Candidatus Culexarchaeum yellowstonense]